MSLTHKGGCLCGAVRFEIGGAFDHFFLCHCSRCRKDTGSAHAANLFASDARLVWLAGADKVATFDLPDTRHSRSFCATCGSALPRGIAGTTRVVVPAGSLETPVPNRPDAHIFCADRADWDDAPENVPRVPGGPS